MISNNQTQLNDLVDSRINMFGVGLEFKDLDYKFNPTRGFFIATDEITFVAWHGLFSGLVMKVFTMATLVSIMIHVRIGLWQVLTDYVKAASVRMVVQWVLNLIAFAYVLIGLFVLWGV